LRNNYGASEFYSIASECAHGRLHVNDDWVILEPVDERLQPVPVGEQSASTLLTNLANYTQPLVRYDLGDRIRCLAGPCECGSRFPAIEVEGRADDTLSLDDASGHAVTVLPLALTTAVEEGAHVAQFQLLRTAPDALEMRFEATVRDVPAAYERARLVLETFLARQGLANVRIERGQAAPLRQPRSGKLRRVCCLDTSAA
jgi:phenylacetate-coenzyme A ligase PaaK-like adenylate-forming protein